MKADDKIKFENEEGMPESEKYSHFDFLQKKVEVLQKHIEVISRILEQKEMTKVTEDYKMPPDFEDETYKKLEADD